MQTTVVSLLLLFYGRVPRREQAKTRSSREGARLEEIRAKERGIQDALLKPLPPE